MCNRILLIIASSFSLVAALVLSFESFLIVYGKSLCSTAACEIVSHYLTISKTLLITAGAGFFWILSILFFFAHRYPRKISYVPYLFLVIALSFDGVLIGFQFFTIQQKCLLCISVAATLLIISVLYCLAYKKYFFLFCCLFVWSGGFAANSIMKMPAPEMVGKKMVIYQKLSKADLRLNQTKNTFIFSMVCPHCFDIISTLAETNVRNTTWEFASIDNDRVSLMKLSKFRQEAPKSENPFRLLKQIKQESIQNYEIPKVVKENTANASNFLSNLNIAAIPVLIIDNTKGNIQILIGVPNILEAISKP